MSDPDYEYHGMMAETWDLFRGDTSNWEDRPFYLELIRASGEPALDVGCGTGRLLLDYLSQGVDIDGVDISPEMLALCRQKAQAMGLKPALFESSMETMHLTRRYKTIIVPSSSFQLVLEPQQAQAAMRNLFDHLLPGGILGMPFMREAKEEDDRKWHLTGEKVRPGDGAVVKRWSRSWYDAETQLAHTEDRYEVFIEGFMVSQELHRRSPATREYSPKQAEGLYKAAGFVDIHMVQGFTRHPAEAEDEVFTITGKKL